MSICVCVEAAVRHKLLCIAIISTGDWLRVLLCHSGGVRVRIQGRKCFVTVLQYSAVLSLSSTNSPTVREQAKTMEAAVLPHTHIYNHQSISLIASLKYPHCFFPNSANNLTKTFLVSLIIGTFHFIT